MTSNDKPLAIGIDLGTTYSCIAYVDEYGQPVVIKNFEGHPTTPSVVYFGDNNEVVVGTEAKKAARTDPDKVVELIKRSMGKENQERFIGNTSYRPEEISAQVLKKLLKDATLFLGRPIDRAVITCPAYFGINERKATAQAGVIAGLRGYTLTEPEIIPEPTAAAFYYGLQKTDRDEVVLVYDLGGGTFDVTLLSVRHGSVEAICIGGDAELGGKDWDDDLMNFCSVEARERGIDLPDDDLFLADLRLNIEESKRSLTGKEKVVLSMVVAGQPLRIELTRERFDELTQARLERTISLCNDMLTNAAAKGYAKFDRILLVGGSTRMPQVRKRLEREYPGIPIDFNEPDEAVAKGAALFAQKLLIDGMLEEETTKLFELAGGHIDDAGRKKIEKQALDQVATTLGLPASRVYQLSQTVVKNCTSKTFGVVAVDPQTKKKILVNLIKRFSPLPVEVTQQFGTEVPHQPSAEIKVMESETSEDRIEDLNRGREIGNAVLPLPSGLPENSPIEIYFHLDQAGLLSFSGKDMSSGAIIKGDIKTDAALSDEELKKATERSSSTITA